MNNQPITIFSNFGEVPIEIGFDFLFSNERNIISVSGGKLYMMQGRMYYIPVFSPNFVDNINSDEYIIKVPSDVASRFDIRYIKDNLACIVPIRHNAILRNNEKLCILTKM